MPLSSDISPTPQSSLAHTTTHVTLQGYAGEVIGQCERCLDFFSVTVIRSRTRAGRLEVYETPRLVWRTNHNTKQSYLIHRPGVCSGKVRLFYGSSDTKLARPTSGPPQTARHVVPEAVYPPASWR